MQKALWTQELPVRGSIYPTPRTRKGRFGLRLHRQGPGATASRRAQGHAKNPRGFPTTWRHAAGIRQNMLRTAVGQRTPRGASLQARGCGMLSQPEGWSPSVKRLTSLAHLMQSAKPIHDSHTLKRRSHNEQEKQSPEILGNAEVCVCPGGGEPCPPRGLQRTALSTSLQGPSVAGEDDTRNLNRLPTLDNRKRA